MRPPLRIAILECDVPLPKTTAEYGGYGGVFEALLRPAAKALGLPDTALEITKWNILAEEDKYPKLEDIDAILITGSRHNSFDNEPWILKLVEYTSKVLAHDRVRLIGVCFGHQIVGRALGAKVGRSDGGWEVAVNDIELTDKGKELFGVDKLRLQQMHRDIVHSCPSNVTLLGSSPACAVQGLYVPRRFITVQGHPEFTDEIMFELLETRKYMGVFPEGVYEGGIKRFANEHDGSVVSQAFIKFLLEE